MHNSAVYKQADGFTTEFEDMRQVQEYCPAAEVSDLTSSNLAPSRDLKRVLAISLLGEVKNAGDSSDSRAARYGSEWNLE
jgi:hypothetical protein